MAEHSAVNRRVVGSSPTCGAIFCFHVRFDVRIQIQPSANTQSGFRIVQTLLMSQQVTLTAGNELPLDRCPHCGISRPRISLLQPWITAPYTGGQRWWKVYQCSTCGGVVTVQSSVENGPVVAMFPQGRTIDESIPDRARRHLREAMDTLSSPGASIVASASAVDAMLKARNYRESRLYARIDQ